MAIAKEITQCSWLLETNKGDKLGIISFSVEKEKYFLISEDLQIEFESMGELAGMLGEHVTQETRKDIEAKYSTLEGWPIYHNVFYDVKTDDAGRVTYRASERSSVVFYAGYWVVPNTERTGYIMRVSASTDMVEQAAADGFPARGPFNDKIQAKFTAKQLSNAMK